MTQITHYLKAQKINILALGGIIVFTLICLQYNYLLFHVFVELFSVVIIFSLFIITWNTRENIDNQFLLLLGLTAVPIGFLDTFHIVTYQGMNIINSDIFYANQFWIAARTFESVSILAGLLLLLFKRSYNSLTLFTAFSLIGVMLILSILYFENFPVCYLEDEGQTAFKIYAEYVIILLLFISLVLLYRQKGVFERNTYRLLLCSVILTIISEFSFTLYVSNFGFMNQLGHFAKLFSFYMVYKAMVETGFKQPTATLFRNLKLSKERFHAQSIELSELNATKDKFFRIIAHDLRNPFNTLLGFSNVLVEDYKDLSKEEIKSIAMAMNESAEKTFTLLENLLEWSNIQSGKLSPEFTEVDIDELIQLTVGNTIQVANAKQIVIKRGPETGVSVQADKDMLRTVLRNLITNAVKFTDAGGTVSVSAYSNEDHVLFEVSDNGVGIDRNHIDELFRVAGNLSRSGTENEKGTGLGLIMCKEFVQMHKGQIWAESEKGMGSTFIFTIPKGMASKTDEQKSVSPYKRG